MAESRPPFLGFGMDSPVDGDLHGLDDHEGHDDLYRAPDNVVELPAQPTTHPLAPPIELDISPPLPLVVALDDEHIEPNNAPLSIHMFSPSAFSTPTHTSSVAASPRGEPSYYIQTISPFESTPKPSVRPDVVNFGREVKLQQAPRFSGVAGRALPISTPSAMAQISRRRPPTMPVMPMAEGLLSPGIELKAADLGLGQRQKTQPKHKRAFTGLDTPGNRPADFGGGDAFKPLTASPKPSPSASSSSHMPASPSGNASPTDTETGSGTGTDTDTGNPLIGPAIGLAVTLGLLMIGLSTWAGIVWRRKKLDARGASRASSLRRRNDAEDDDEEEGGDKTEEEKAIGHAKSGSMASITTFRNRSGFLEVPTTPDRPITPPPTRQAVLHTPEPTTPHAVLSLIPANVIDSGLVAAQRRLWPLPPPRSSPYYERTRSVLNVDASPLPLSLDSIDEHEEEDEEMQSHQGHHEEVEWEQDQVTDNVDGQVAEEEDVEGSQSDSEDDSEITIETGRAAYVSVLDVATPMPSPVRRTTSVASTLSDDSNYSSYYTTASSQASCDHASMSAITVTDTLPRTPSNRSANLSDRGVESYSTHTAQTPVTQAAVEPSVEVDTAPDTSETPKARPRAKTVNYSRPVRIEGSSNEAARTQSLIADAGSIEFVLVSEELGSFTFVPKSETDDSADFTAAVELANNEPAALSTEAEPAAPTVEDLGLSLGPVGGLEVEVDAQVAEVLQELSETPDRPISPGAESLSSIETVEVHGAFSSIFERSRPLSDESAGSLSTIGTGVVRQLETSTSKSNCPYMRAGHINKDGDQSTASAETTSQHSPIADQSPERRRQTFPAELLRRRQSVKSGSGSPPVSPRRSEVVDKECFKKALEAMRGDAFVLPPLAEIPMNGEPDLVASPTMPTLGEAVLGFTAEVQAQAHQSRLDRYMAELEDNKKRLSVDSIGSASVSSEGANTGEGAASTKRGSIDFSQLPERSALAEFSAAARNTFDDAYETEYPEETLGGGAEDWINDPDICPDPNPDLPRIEVTCH